MKRLQADNEFFSNMARASARVSTDASKSFKTPTHVATAVQPALDTAILSELEVSKVVEVPKVVEVTKVVEVPKVVEAAGVGNTKKNGPALPDASLAKLDKAVIETIENEVCVNRCK